jgi:transcriptional regulator with XRE-family HTH domain
MNKSEVLKLIRQAVHDAGSQTAFARQCGVTTQYINDLLRGRRDPGAKILDALGIEKTVIVSYRTKEDTHDDHNL